MKHILLGALAIAGALTSCTNNSVNPDITTTEIKEHITFLASDSLKGRKPGTAEGKIAANYIASEFEKAGLKKLSDSYFQEFKVVTKVNEGTNNNFSVNGVEAKLGEDFRPLAFSKNTEANANVVFVGYGIEFESDSLKWNDYNNVDVEGKWVMMLRQDPDVNNSDSPLINQSSERAKALLAVDKGAIGVLFVSGINTEKKDILDELYFDKSKSRADIPVVQISRKLANQILSKKDKTIEKLEDEIITDFKTNSFETKINISVKTDVIYEKVTTQNIIAKIEGSDAKLKDEVIIIGAHYDHLGFGGPGSGSRRPDEHAVHNGADDNASGVAGIIEIAIGGTGTTPISAELINKYAEGKDLKIQMSKEGSGPSDHASFYVKNIPVLFFFTGIHDDYHTPADDTEKINLEGEKVVAELGYDLALEFANIAEAPKFVLVDNPSLKTSRRKLKVTFGIIPNYAGGDDNGMRIDGVKKGGPASNGGMLKGDIIVAIDGKKVANIYDYMARLGRLKKGERCNVDVLRDGKKVVLILDL